jgi:glycylpeptide N-tetradecanoyltransferase
LYDTHDFWDSQPVPKSTDEPTDADFDKAIDVEKKVEDIRDTPLDIPAGFFWSNINIEDDAECQEVYELLT